MADITEITSNVTAADGVVTGDGIFDDLMESITAHIENQFDQSRITGTEYATVYLGAMQTALAQSVQFALSKDTETAQVNLIEEQIANQQAQLLQIIAATDNQHGQVISESVLDEGYDTLTASELTDSAYALNELQVKLGKLPSTLN